MNLSADNVRDSMPLFRSGCGGAIPTSAHQLLFHKTNVHRACELNQLWHSRFPKIDWSNVVRNKDYICFVAEHDAIAYASAIWSSPIARMFKNASATLELRRLAISGDAPKNTASRMLGWMRRYIIKNLQHITLLISYQDTDVHEGTIYKASGWGSVNKSKGHTWTRKTRKRNKDQSMSDKIRWELCLR
jgi:hypothetical protein